MLKYIVFKFITVWVGFVSIVIYYRVTTYKLLIEDLTIFLSYNRYWVSEMHVDGFRFDLASIMTRSSRLYIVHCFSNFSGD